MKKLVKKDNFIFIFLTFLILIMPVLLFKGVTSRKIYRQKAQVVSPTLTPPVTPPVFPAESSLFFKVKFQGLPESNYPPMGVSLKAKGTNFEKFVILSEKGESGEISLEGLQPEKTYDFLLSCWGFLTSKKTLTLKKGRNPDSGYLDFGTLKAGDLNGDDQINGLDWSLMKMYYGSSGD